MNKIFVLLIVHFSTSFQTLNLLQNSSGFYEEEKLLKTNSLTLNEIVANYPFQEIILTENDIDLIIDQELEIFNNITIMGLNNTSPINLVLENKGSIIIANHSNFSLIFIDILINNYPDTSVSVANSSVLYIIKSNLNNFSASGEFFCLVEGFSMIHIENMTIQNFTRNFVFGIFYLFYGKNSTFEFLNLKFNFNNFVNFSFIKTINSQVKFYNSSFIRNIIQNNNNANIVESGPYLSIMSSNFTNNTMDCVLLSGSGSNSNDSFFNISSSIFLNNTGFTSSHIVLINNIDNINVVVFNSNSVINHISDIPVIELIHINMILFKSSEFIENIAENLIYLFNIYYLSLINTVFSNNNNATSINSNLMQLGSCLNLENFQTVYIQNCMLLNSYANTNLPGFYFYNDFVQTQTIEVLDSIFTNNNYSSQNFVNSYGCIFSFISIASISLSNVSFSQNLVNLPLETYGGPCIYFQNLKTIIQLNSGYFYKNQAFKGSLIMEGNADSVYIHNSIFIENSQYTGDLGQPTTYVIKGALRYLIMKNCSLSNNQANFGIYFFYELKVFIIIDLDSVSMYNNVGSTSAGISLGQETYNRTITWKNSEFKSNVAYGLATFIFVYILREINTLNITIENFNISDNYNPYENALYVSWCLTNVPVLKILSCYFGNNSFYLVSPKNDVGAIINLSGFLKGYKTYIEDSVFDSNYCYNSWTVVFFVQTFIKNVVFNNNSCVLTGLFYFDTSSFSTFNVLITNSVIDYVHFIAFNQLSVGNITNMTFINNSIQETCIASLKFNSLSLKDIKIVNLVANSNAIIFYFKKTVVDLMQNISLMNVTTSNYLVYGEYSSSNMSGINYNLSKFTYIFYFVKHSSLLFNDSLITYKMDDDSNIKFDIFLFRDSIILIHNLEMIGHTIFHFNYFTVTNCNVTLDESTMKSLLFIKTKYLFSMINSNMTITNSIFTNSSNILSSSKGGIQISFTSISNFDSKTISTLDNIISCIDTIFMIIDSNIINNIVSNSSIIYISGSFYDQTDQNNVFLINNNSFMNNLCFDCSGSSLYISNANFSLTYNLFQLNQANYGGGLYIYCSSNTLTKCHFNLSFNNFISNNANFGGGAYKWEIMEPYSNNNSFINNSAKYGNNYTSFFCRLGLKIYDPTSNLSLIYDSFSSNFTEFFILTDIISSKNIPYNLNIYALDSYNQIILDHLNTIVEISILPDNASFENTYKFKNAINNLSLNDEFYCNSSNSSRTYGDLTLAQTIIYDFECSFLSIISCPTSMVYLQITAQGLSRSPTNIYNHVKSPNEIIYQNSYYLVLPLLMKPCEIGEIYDSINQICTSCPTNYFTLDPKTYGCSICPAHATCDGTDKLELEANFWRTNSQSLDFQLCNPYIENCLGGVNSSCAAEYQGVLCEDCSNDNLYKNFIGSCQECSDPVSQIFKNIILYLMLIAMLCGFCFIFISKQISQSHVFLGKIIIIYFHYLIANFSLQVNIVYAPLKQYFNFLHNLSKMNFWISIFCLHLPSNKLFENFFLMLLLYLIFALIYFGMKFYFGRSLARKSFYILLYIISPMVFNFLLSNFICIKIDSTYYLNEDTTILCSDPQYPYWITFFFAPNLVLFCLIIPFTIYRKLKTQTGENVYDKRVDGLFIYTSGYQKKYCYFDVVLYFRNVAIIFINVYNFDISIKVSITLIILTYSLITELYLKVYQNKRFYKLCTTIQVIFMINNYLLIYSTNSTTSESNKFYTIIFPFLLIFHTYFIISCGLLIFEGKIRRSIIRMTSSNNTKAKYEITVVKNDEKKEKGKKEKNAEKIIKKVEFIPNSQEENSINATKIYPIVVNLQMKNNTTDEKREGNPQNE